LNPWERKRAIPDVDYKCLETYHDALSLYQNRNWVKARKNSFRILQIQHLIQSCASRTLNG